MNQRKLQSKPKKSWFSLLNDNIEDNAERFRRKSEPNAKNMLPNTERTDDFPAT